MDELDKIKKIFDSSIEGKIQQPTDPLLIENIIRSKSTDPISRLKKNLLIEIWAGVLTILVLIVLMVELTGTYFTIKLGAMIAILLAFVGYYYVNLRKMTKIWRKSQENVKQSIISTILLFRFYRRYYIILSMVLFPLTIYFGYLIGYGIGSNGQQVAELLFHEILPPYVVLIVNLLLFGLIYGGFWHFLRLYVKRLYDAHIHKLEKILNELLENEIN